MCVCAGHPEQVVVSISQRAVNGGGDKYFSYAYPYPLTSYNYREYSTDNTKRKRVIGFSITGLKFISFK